MNYSEFLFNVFNFNEIEVTNIDGRLDFICCNMYCNKCKLNLQCKHLHDAIRFDDIDYQKQLKIFLEDHPEYLL